MLTGLVPQPQGAPPPGQLEGAPPGVAEFVMCDCTIEQVFKETKPLLGSAMSRIGLPGPQ
ncbi:MAG TPA: hypothetical protein VGC99_07390 [Candidatus Tectomicrobia bacterium]